MWISTFDSERKRSCNTVSALSSDEYSNKVTCLTIHLMLVMLLKVKVARLTNFGAFVDIGGVDGLVHVSELSHEHVDSPEDVVSVGQEVDVKVKSVEKDAERISLSIKRYFTYTI